MTMTLCYPFKVGRRPLAYLCPYRTSLSRDFGCLSRIRGLKELTRTLTGMRHVERQKTQQTNKKTIDAKTGTKHHLTQVRTPLSSHLNRKLGPATYGIKIHTVFSYAIGSRKLSANEQFFVGAQTVVSFFVGAQTVVSLLQTTQIKQGVSFIACQQSLHQHK